MEGEDFSTGSAGEAATFEPQPFGTEMSHDAMQHNMEQNMTDMEGSRPPSRRGSSRGSADPSRSVSITGPPSPSHLSFSQDRPPSRQSSRAGSAAGSQAQAPAAAEGSMGDMPSPPSRQNSKSESLKGRGTPSVQGTPEHSQKELSAASGSGSPRERLLRKSRSRSGSGAGTPEASQEDMEPNKSEASFAAPPSKEPSKAGSVAGSQRSASKPPSAQASLMMASRENSAAEIAALPSKSPSSKLGSAAGSRRSSRAQDSTQGSMKNLSADFHVPTPGEQPSREPSAADSIAGSQRSASKAPSSAHGTAAEASMEDLHAVTAAEGPSRAGSVAGSQRSAASKAPSARGSLAMSREPSVAEDPSFGIPEAAQADELQLPVAQDSGGWHDEPPADIAEGSVTSPLCSALKKPKASRTPKEVAPRSPEWCLQMFGDGTEITREDLTEFLKEYCQDGRVLRLPAHEFNHMDFDCNGSLDRDEFYFFFYGWLAHKIQVEEDVYQNPRLREEAHQLCWIFEVYRCVSALSLDMTLRPWLTLCSDAGLLTRQSFEKKDAEMIFKKTIRASCNASGVEPRAGIGYMEFLEALRLISVKKQVSFADIVEDVLFVGASHRTNLDRNRFRDLASSSLTPMVDSTIKEPNGEFHAALTEELYQPGTRSVSFHADRIPSPTRRSVTARSSGQATSLYNNLQWNERDSTWRRKKSTGLTATSLKDTTPQEAPPTVEAFSGFDFEATVPAPLSEENVKVSERETKLELQLADMTSQRDQGNEAMARMEDRLREMEERMAMLAGENGALMDRVSRLEVRTKDAEDAKQAADEYIALLEQNLAIASASAVANAQSNEEIMAGLQKKAEELHARSPNRASIMEHLTKRREARRGSRQSPTSSLAFS